MAARLKDLTSMVPPPSHEKRLQNRRARLAAGRRSSGARRWRRRESPFPRVSGGVVRLIAKRLPRFIKKLKRLLKQPRRRRTLRHGGLQDVQPGPMPVDRGEGPGSLGVEELQLMSFNPVRGIPRVV